MSKSKQKENPIPLKPETSGNSVTNRPEWAGDELADADITAIQEAVAAIQETADGFNTTRVDMALSLADVKLRFEKQYGVPRGRGAINHFKQWAESEITKLSYSTVRELVGFAYEKAKAGETHGKVRDRKAVEAAIMKDREDAANRAAGGSTRSPQSRLSDLLASFKAGSVQPDANTMSKYADGLVSALGNEKANELAQAILKRLQGGAGEAKVA